MTFEDQNLLESLDAATPSELDALPYGVVRMNTTGEIIHYNTYESELASIPQKEAAGKNFFVQIAPCTNNFMVSHKYNEEGDLDETLPYVFTYALKPTKVTLRLLKKAGSEFQYLLALKAA